MNIYEHTYIAAPEANKKDIENIEKKIEDILNKSSGKIHKTEDWGLRNLAYPIKKITGLLQKSVLGGKQRIN